MTRFDWGWRGSEGTSLDLFRSLCGSKQRLGTNQNSGPAWDKLEVVQLVLI